MALSLKDQDFQRYFRGITFDIFKGGCPGNWRRPDEAARVAHHDVLDDYAVLWWVITEIEYCLTLTDGFIDFDSTRGENSGDLWTNALVLFNGLHDYGKQKRKITKWRSFQTRWEKGREELKRMCGERH